jgi:O-antigen ligase
LVIAGTAGFVARYLGFFQRGATSVVARFDYWTAACKNIAMNPVLGSGPGTFATVYLELKSPEAEMARLVHNDYLQQASDSGVPAGLLFTGFMIWVLWVSRWAWTRGGWTAFGAWLGLGVFALQSGVEFGFYVPATAWCWFALAGWLVGQGGLRFDNRGHPA